MKKRIITAFLAISLIMSLSVIAVANQVQKTITVTYSGIKLNVNGTEVIPKDASGNVVEPFIYNGTTYLPVRAVGNALGKGVIWDGNTQTVFIGDQDASVPTTSPSPSPSTSPSHTVLYYKDTDVPKLDNIVTASSTMVSNEGGWCYSYDLAQAQKDNLSFSLDYEDVLELYGWEFWKTVTKTDGTIYFYYASTESDFIVATAFDIEDMQYHVFVVYK